jgi:predicted ester cyclase
MRPRHVMERYLAEVLYGAGPARPEELISSLTLQQRVIGFRSAFPDLHVTTHTLVVEGDLVAAHLTGRGIHQGLFQGVPATGRGWQADCIAVYRIHDGRIAEAWVHWDQLTLMEQLGAIRARPNRQRMICPERIFHGRSVSAPASRRTRRTTGA